MSAVLVEVLTDRCAGCQECLIRCPVEAIDLDVDRYVVTVDGARCVGCRQCERVCPFDAIVVAGDAQVDPGAILPELDPEVALTGLDEVRGGFENFADVLAEANRCLACPDPTCVRGCPTHNDIPEFIAQLRSGDLAGARDVLSAHTSLPEICSRVCDAAIQCEGSCSWRLAGARPVAIHAIERYIADHADPIAPTPDAKDGRVLIVGSGPAGLGAADVLSAAGVEVTVVEAADHIGGLLRNGIPRFTLPAEVLDRVVERLERRGVEFRVDTVLSPSDVQAASSRYDAVVLAVGAGAPLPVRADGIESIAVGNALDEIAVAEAAIQAGLPPVNDRVLVVGAGNTAMDVARLVRRRGGSAVCIDWMDQRFSLVRPDELAEAQAEGVQVRFAVTLRSVVERDDGIHCVLVRTRQERASERPTVTEEVAEELVVDRVVAAMGYRVDPSWIASVPGLAERKEVGELPSRHWLASGLFAGEPLRGLRVGELAWSRDRARRRAAAWRQARTWAIGDVLVGPSTVVEAMAHGRRVGEEILAAGGRNAVLPSRRLAPPRVLIAYDSKGGHTRAAALSLGETLANFAPNVRCIPADQFETEDLVDADLIVVAGWVDGALVVGQRPSDGMRRLLEALPVNLRAPVGLLLTYAVDPGDALKVAEDLVRARGATVAAAVALGPQGSPGDERRFIVGLGEAAWAEASSLADLVNAVLEGADPRWLVGPRPRLAEALAHTLVERHGRGVLSHEAEAAERLRELASSLRLLREAPIPS